VAADLGDGTDDPRATAPDLLRRALAALPERARKSGRVAMRADAGYFAGQLARTAHDAKIAFAIGAKRIAPLWRLLAGIAEEDWHEAIEMDNAQVAVAQYCPDWWPADTWLLIRRVILDPEQVSADPRSRRRRTLHPDQRALPIPELASAGAIYAHSFILTNLDVSSPDKAAAVEHWYRHRTTVVPGRRRARYQESWHIKIIYRGTVSSPRYSRNRVRAESHQVRKRYQFRHLGSNCRMVGRDRWTRNTAAAR
jgi:hypothetical protein